MCKPFRVVHYNTTQEPYIDKECWAYGETEKGFVYRQPLFPLVGLTNPSKCLLLKPMWKRKEKTNDKLSEK